MKKISLILVFALVLGLLSGCAGTPVVYYTDCTCPADSHTVTEATQATEATEATQATEPAAQGALKTGLKIVAGIGDSTNGEAKYDVTVAAVAVDENGVIVSCALDSLGTSIKFDESGVITTDLTTVPMTKNELGDAYNMKAYGGAKYEWYEQAAAVAAYAVGKTAEELRSGAVDETGHAVDADLASTATIYIGGYVNAIADAADNAQALGAQAGDALKLAIIAGLGSSADATAEKAGNAQLDLDVTAITMNGETITSCILDSVQAKVGFDAAGAITSDVSAPVATKAELGEAYGMKAYAGAKYEWNEQAANFAAYVTGKTAADVMGIAVAEGKPSDTDLASSVTISIGGFQALIAKAAVYVPQGGELKTGLKIVAGVGDSTNGEAKYDLTVAAVTVDENGVIVGCALDSLGTSVKFDEKGVITSDLTAAPATKNELGDGYNMKAYGGAKYEWYEQAAAVAAYAVGKTAEELRNGAVDETGHATDVDLASTATIYIGGYINAIADAADNAQALGATAGDQLKLAIIADLGDSADATAEKAGNAQLNVDVAVITVNGDVITSCALDSVQAKVGFDTTGAITSDVSAPVATKNELGEAYGMKAYAGAKYEWNEQAANFAAYVTGKTADEVAGIAVTEGKPSDADLSATVTIAIGGFQALIEKACK